MQYWIVLFSVALDFTSTLKCVFVFYSKYTAALICLWRAYFTTETKLNSFNNNFSIYCFPFWKKGNRKNKENEKKKEKEMHIVTLWRILYFCCTLQTAVFYTVVQQFMCAVVFSFSISAAIINIRSWEKYNTVQF